MPANSWPENDSYNELDAIGSLLSDLSATEESAVETLDKTSLQSCYKGRRRKAAVVLTIVWSGTIALHLVSWGSWFVLGLTTMFGIPALRMALARPRRDPRLVVAVMNALKSNAEQPRHAVADGRSERLVDHDPAAGAFVLEGEEGMGKSWAAAACRRPTRSLPARTSAAVSMCPVPASR